MTFATTSDVATYTGVTVTNDALVMASSIVELFCNRTEAQSGDWATKDLRLLKMATCYQAAYMDSHPEFFTTMDVSTLMEGDINITFRGDSDALVLAPLAKKAIKKLSWNRTRSIATNSHFTAPTEESFDEF